MTGRYGVNCDYHCITCTDSICDRQNGHCTYGCIEGFKGDGCHLLGIHSPILTPRTATLSFQQSNIPRSSLGIDRWIRNSSDSNAFRSTSQQEQHDDVISGAGTARLSDVCWPRYENRLTPQLFIKVALTGQEMMRLFICVLWINIFPLSTIFGWILELFQQSSF
jgi:hypothetical protein